MPRIAQLSAEALAADQADPEAIHQRCRRAVAQLEWLRWRAAEDGDEAAVRVIDGSLGRLRRLASISRPP